MGDSYGAWAARLRVPLGFAFAAAFAGLSHPTRALLIAGSLVALAGLWLRGLSAGYIRKNEELATGGPFRYTRNPLYLGSFILGLGFIIAGASLVLAMAFIVLFALIYIPVMRREAAYLRYLFGPSYDAYASQVSLFIPVRRSKGQGKFQWRQYWKNREYEAALGWLAIFLFLTVKLMLR
jgi:protein-S-isoprenylcysteine O-methyltransferase Ste14